MKKLGFILMACALIIGASQCKKNDESNKPENNSESVFITLNVGGGTRANVVPEEDIAPVYYAEGDMIHVVSDGKYIGTLTYNGTNFSGDITNPTEDQPLHFYFLGNVTPTESLVVGETSSCFVIISDQTISHPVISYAASNQYYSEATTNYTATLLNKCALVKFNVTTASDAATCISGMNNKVTVDFTTNEFAYSQESDGVITLAAGNGEKWVILLPQDALEAGEEGTAYTEDGTLVGMRPAIPTITENGYFKEGLRVVFENPLLPTVITNEVTTITTNSAIGGGELINQGASEVTECGICWSSSSNPETTDNTILVNSELGTFSCMITEIELGNTYFVRAFATNEFGTAYGEEVSFTVGVGALYEFDDGTMGIIFYMNQELHGLVVSLETGQGQWTTRNVNIAGIPNAYPAPTWLEVGLGLTYTNALISQVGTSGAPAAAWCRSKGTNWYLPSLGELYTLGMAKNLVDIGLIEHGGSAIGYNSYWSSSEYNNQASWLIEYGSNARNYYKRSSFYVKAVRLF